MSEALVAALRRVGIEASHRDGVFEIAHGDDRVSMELRGAWMPGSKPPKLAFPLEGLDGYALGLRGYPCIRHVGFGDLPEAARRQVRDQVGLAAYQTSSNDEAITAELLDGPPRRALVDAVTVQSELGDDNLVTVTLHGLDAALEDDTLVVKMQFADDHNLATAVRVGAALVVQPRRIVAGQRNALSAVGARLDAEGWRLDDTCTAVFVRDAATVQIDWRRRLPGEPKRRARLRTRLRAHGPLAPTAIDDAWLRPRLDALRPLVAGAGADSITAVRGVITLCWDGLISKADRLAPAIELLCRLVAPPPSAPSLR